MNYVRKLGFEEQPDYDFMRDLFTKALEGTGEVEDGVYDWMLLNGGKGWQANSVSRAEYAIGPFLSFPHIPLKPHPSFRLSSPPPLFDIDADAVEWFIRSGHHLNMAPSALAATSRLRFLSGIADD